ncbi:MAG: oligoribonuclease [Planctomycetota bacterium]
MLDRTLGNLIWIDLEFTDLDPSRGAIMQAAMIVTRPDLTPVPPPGIEPGEGGLQYAISLDEAQVATASDWVKEHQAEHLRRSRDPEESLPVEKVEELFVAYLLACSEVPDAAPKRPILAGNSIHGDRNYLARYMPRLISLLSYRLLDVSTLKELASRWCPSLVFTKTSQTIGQWYPAEVKVEGEVHDALFDIKGSIAELAFYRQHLLAPVARPQGS